MSILKETAGLASLWLGKDDSKASKVYDLLAQHNNLGEKTLFLNLGYWDGPVSYDDGCRRLAEVLGEAAEMGPADEVVDCGYGHGDQDFFWLERFKPKRITGLNITATQVAVAQRRAQERGFAKDRLDLREGSATAMPLPDASADLVTALETAFHYVTREDFFREAFRVLRPGGRLVTADIIPKPNPPTGLVQKAGEWVGRRFWQIPPANMYPSPVYRQKLVSAGFQVERLDSIAGMVYPGFAACARRRLKDKDVQARMHLIIRTFFALSLDEMAGPGGPDYILCVARKPA
jgi:ubiquinone/menaquinone biosynthesis C-methylase UbiE